ncbi:hypothetical protein O6H91_Y342900 [Diphasiastrum complanatum]|nr:hypothetical protein O6H91_Y342900 [Diphasiastrum complanatum]
MDDPPLTPCLLQIVGLCEKSTCQKLGERRQREIEDYSLLISPTLYTSNCKEIELRKERCKNHIENKTQLRVQTSFFSESLNNSLRPSYFITKKTQRVHAN